MNEIRVMVLDPGHFHAALVQKEMYPELSKRVYVYAPVGGDVLDYLNRVTAFNLRQKDPIGPFSLSNAAHGGLPVK